MTTERRLERDLPSILGDLAMGPYPDYIDDVLATTARRRQRPAWTFPERWLPMVDIARQPAFAPRLPWRWVGLLALLVVAAVAGAALIVGSQRALPEPFGPAANGLIVYDALGDIYVADPVSGVTEAIVSGPETDTGPVWSRDGTRIAFQRKPVGGVTGGLLLVARADGTGVVQVTPEPLVGLTRWSFSPDGGSIVALAMVEYQVRIVIASSDGQGQLQVLGAPVAADDGAPEFRPPDGKEILFIRRESTEALRGVYAVDPVTEIVRTIVAPSSRDVYAATWSPDGSRIAYGSFDPNADGVSSRTHVVAADGTGDFQVDDHPDTIADGSPMVWSNDGTRLIITRVYGGSGDRTRSAIVPVDGSGLGIEIDCPTTTLGEACAVEWSWSPDDGSLLGTVSIDDKPQQILADSSTGAVRPLTLTTDSSPAWQRLAP